MRQLPSRFRRLDGALADLPLEEPMLLTELDGFLTGVLVCPVAIPGSEWMQTIWGVDEGGLPPFDEPADVQWFADAVMARYREIERDLVRGKPQPIFDIDDRNGDILWELWIDGFAEVKALRPDAWAIPSSAEAREALSRIELLIAAAEDDGTLDGMEIDALQVTAVSDISRCMPTLYRAAGRTDAAATAAPTKVGRNDPCPCGSGKKSKRCCG